MRHPYHRQCAFRTAPLVSPLCDIKSRSIIIIPPYFSFSFRCAQPGVAETYALRPEPPGKRLRHDNLSLSPSFNDFTEAVTGTGREVRGQSQSGLTGRLPMLNTQKKPALYPRRMAAIRLPMRQLHLVSVHSHGGNASALHSNA